MSAAAAAACEWVRCRLLGFRASSWWLPPCACSSVPPPAASVHAGGRFSWFAWAARAVVALRAVGAARRTCGDHALQEGRMVSACTPVCAACTLVYAACTPVSAPMTHRLTQQLQCNAAMQAMQAMQAKAAMAVAAFSISNFQTSQHAALPLTRVCAWLLLDRGHLLLVGKGREAGLQDIAQLTSALPGQVLAVSINR